MSDATMAGPLPNVNDVLLPGAKIGMMGAGQLGRMFAMAAARMGYHVHVFSPCADSPAGQVSHRETVADWHDEGALRNFSQAVDAVTFEWESIPASAIETVEKYVAVWPGHDVLHITQHRLREKQFVSTAGIPCAPFAEVNSLSDLESAIEVIGAPCVLKTAVAGYDGKGQFAIREASEAGSAWDFVKQQPSILEGWVDYEQEISVLVARSVTGEVVTCGPIGNDHVNHILDVSKLPVPELSGCAAECQEIGRTIAEKLSLVGVCCVEMFVTRDGKLLVNEIAPRPHNSGHLTIESCLTSQFEQQVRAVCGLPLGLMTPHSPAAMVNLLGDLWENGRPLWQELLKVPQGFLHLYGKSTAKPGRKMGHFTVLGDSAGEAARAALDARNRLRLVK